MEKKKKKVTSFPTVIQFTSTKQNGWVPKQNEIFFSFSYICLSNQTEH